MIKPVRTPNRSNIAPNNKEPIPWIIEKNDFKLAYVVDSKHTYQYKYCCRKIT